MTLTLEPFYAKYPAGSRVDTDGFPKDQPYQCVDLTKAYVHDVFDMPITAYGNAVDWWTNPKILAKFDQITNDTKQEGDILVWGNDAGTFTGPAGHIAIWRAGKIYNQNYNNSGKISNNNFFTAGYLGALRPKGGSTMAKANLDTARILAHGILARNGLAGRSNALDGSQDVELKANHVGQELTNEYIQSLFLSAEGRAWRDVTTPKSIPGINEALNSIPAKDTQIKSLLAENAQLKAQIAAGSSGTYKSIATTGTEIFVKV